MLNYLKGTNNQILIINLLFITIPLAYIFGSLFVNLNLFLIIILSLIFYKRKIFDIKFLLVDKFVILFFLYSSIVGILNTIEIYNDDNVTNDITIFLKTFLYFRYILIYFVLRFLADNNILKFKWFFYTCAFLCLYVCAEIFYQFLFGQDFFGNKISPIQRKLSGPFGNEWVAGGYLLRFSFFGIFAIAIFSNFKNNVAKNLIISSMVLIFLIGILLSGNRIPFVFFIIGISLIMLFEKKTRKFLPIILFITSIIFYVSFKSKQEVRANYLELFSSVKIISYKMYALAAGHELNYWRYNMPVIFHEWESFYDTWQMNKYFGGGIRSFRLNCPKRENIEIDERITCNTHPHNYYLEIMTDLGLLGLIIILFVFTSAFVGPFYKKYVSKEIDNNLLIIPFLFAFFVEVFPLKSTGSFFTTNVSSIIFLYMAILISLSRKKQT